MNTWPTPRLNAADKAIQQRVTANLAAAAPARGWLVHRNLLVSRNRDDGIMRTLSMRTRYCPDRRSFNLERAFKGSTAIEMADVF